MIATLRRFNITSDMAYLAAAASIVLSIAMWFMRREDGQVDNNAHAERFGIFIGLWAPTLAILARAIEESEKATASVS